MRNWKPNLYTTMTNDRFSPPDRKLAFEIRRGGRLFRVPTIVKDYCTRVIDAFKRLLA